MVAPNLRANGEEPLVIDAAPTDLQPTTKDWGVQGVFRVEDAMAGFAGLDWHFYWHPAFPGVGFKFQLAPPADGVSFRGLSVWVPGRGAWDNRYGLESIPRYRWVRFRGPAGEVLPFEIFIDGELAAYGRWLPAAVDETSDR